jgi:hypothetical protein
MASYFDEHSCEPLGQGEGPNHMMHIARLLIDTGAWNDVCTFYGATTLEVTTLEVFSQKTLEVP